MAPHGLASKTFILGIGAQKAGTTWLYNHLARSPQVACCPIKELHAFDSWFRHDICAEFDRIFLEMLQRRIEQDIKSNKFTKSLMLQCLLLRARMIYDRSAYLELFSLINTPQATHLCEITPSYSVIGVEGFRCAKQMIESAGMNVKLVFLMRDPIERYSSSLRMRERDTGGEFVAKDNFSRLIHTKREFERGRYDVTIENVLSVFDPNDVYFGFYEHLFQERTVREIETFLGINPVPPDLGNRINVSPAGLPLTPAEMSLAKKAFAPVYRNCRARFVGRIPAQWAA